jgi:aspartyl-tRNA(Asn)/glutamyl-tRNA(Gln) amidotransferase subunit A
MAPNIKEKFDTLINFLKQKGVTINELSFPEKEMVVPVYQIISTAEASTNLSRFDGIRYTKREETEKLQDVYKKSRAKYFGEEVKRRIILGTFVLSRDCYDSYYLKAAKLRTLILNRWTNFFKENDAVLIPSTADIAFEFNKQPDTISLYKEDLFTIPANLTGMPAISFPVGTSNKMPVGLQLVGNKLNDNKILNITAKLEKEFYNFDKLKKELQNEK